MFVITVYAQGTVVDYSRHMVFGLGPIHQASKLTYLLSKNTDYQPKYHVMYIVCDWFLSNECLAEKCVQHQFRTKFHKAVKLKKVLNKLYFYAKICRGPLINKIHSILVGKW